MESLLIKITKCQKCQLKKRALKSERKGNNRLIVSFLFTFQKLQNLTKALASKSLPNPSTTFAIFHPFCRWLTFQHVAVENCVEKAVFTFPPPPLSRSSGTRASQNPSDLCYRRFRRWNPPFNFHFFGPLWPDQPYPRAANCWNIR